MKRVKLEHDQSIVYLIITDEVTKNTITVQLDHREAQNLGEGLFISGRHVEAKVNADKPATP